MGMGFRRRCVLGGVALLLCASCGGEKQAAPATTPLPMQASGLAMGGDAQPQATDVARTRITQAQLHRIAAACRKAVEITDADADPCARAVREQFRHVRPCVAGAPCMRVRRTKGGKTRAPGEMQGLVEASASPCGGVCLRIGLLHEADLAKVIEGASPEETAGSPGETAGSPEETAGSPEPGDHSGEPEESSPASPGGGGGHGSDGPGTSTSP
ncbi:hypothetical protein ACQPZP_12835 [Spirillospora sp. CA-142024]|uniref:hypothetical protein n=1 Tax=Spirillospora sp. CA-142024 TaxID=3240036 RepID=UPI003D949031